MNIKSQKGFTLVDIAIAIIILFIFVSLIAFLIYNATSLSNELEYRSDAIYLAIEEIEAIKNKDFSEYENISEANGNSEMTVNEETTKEGFYKTIKIQDYTDIKGSGISGLVKRATVTISYMFKGQIQTIDLSTILSKET